MKFLVVTYHLPHPHGTATGRHVHTVWEAVRAQGHDVQAWSWGDAPAGLTAPEWVQRRPFHDAGGWRRTAHTLRRPRFGLADAGWALPGDRLAWAEEPESYAAIAAASWRGLTVPHSALLDALALREPRPATVQSVRAERWSTGRANVSVALSARVARATGARHVVPVTLPDAAQVPLVDEPVAVLLADWSWRPNVVALQRLLAVWPTVRRRVSDARLVVAGRGDPGVAATPDVEVVGEVDRVDDVLARAAVLAFACPATSGAKMKVLDALTRGVPVVTTAAGVEGLILTPGAVAVAAPGESYAAALGDVLLDPARRARMAAVAREDVRRHHSPQAAAAARLALVAASG